VTALPTTDNLDTLATPLLRLSADDRIEYLNPAAGSWLGLGLRRLREQPVTLIAGAEVSELCRRARAGTGVVRAQRQRFDGGDGEPRYAHVLARAAETDGAVWLELHPVDEFPGEDPATLLPTALNIALKGLAHEIRNPLAGLKGAAQLLRRRLSDDGAEQYLDVIVAETERLGQLVERLLAPGATQALRPTNVHEIIERVRLLAEADAGWAVRIVRDYDPSLPSVAADPDRLTQALWNLVRNALQADASEVRLRTRAEHSVVIGDRLHRLAIRIDVGDDGHGVPEGLAERIFLPLVSGHAEGSGLGLALAQQVAREHGGSLGYRSRPGHTVFSLLLPADGEPTA